MLKSAVEMAKIHSVLDKMLVNGHAVTIGKTRAQVYTWFTRKTPQGQAMAESYRDALSQDFDEGNTSEPEPPLHQDIPFSAVETPSFRKLRSFSEQMHKGDRKKYPTVESAYIEARKQHPELVEKHRDELEKIREARGLRSFSEPLDDRVERAVDAIEAEIDAGVDPVLATGKTLVGWARNG